MIFKILFLCTWLNFVLCIEDPIDSTNNKNQHNLETTSDNDNNKGIVLEYKPTRPWYVPEPVTVPQLIPPGKPWPASPDEYINRSTSTNESKISDNKVVLEYKPTRPWYVPDPVTVPQLIPPGEPWPASPEGYVNKSTLSPHLTDRLSASTESTSLENKIENETDSNKVVLGYKPTRPSYLPDPVTIPQLIPPGKPWPASPEEYLNKSTASTDQNLHESTSLENKIENETDSKIVLGYKPTRPSYVPDPVTIPQLIPPGKPWPASSEEYLNRSTASTDQNQQAENKIEKQTDSKIVLGYKPTRPSYIPDPVTIPQIIPPGKPWPASPEEYATWSPQLINRFPEITASTNQQESTTTNSTPAAPEKFVTKSTLSPHLINRFPELTSTVASTKAATPSTRIVLEYKPQRPFYLPEPVTIGQIIPPGKPWPASLEEYATFSQTTYRPNRFTNKIT